jgi:uncharacterized membrane protein YphA (DoxX/SURF4 family)
MAQPAPRAAQVTARVLQIIVALVFLSAAALKALHPEGFADQIRQYEILPDLALFAAWSFILAEIVLATALVVNVWTRAASWLVIAMLVFFIGITWYGIAVGLSGSCGCFGNLVHRSPEQVIIEDALMIAALGVGLWLQRGVQIRTTTPKLAVLSTAGIAAVLVTAFSGRLPVDSLTTALVPGAHFDSWPVESLYKDLNSETHVVFLISAKSPTIDADVAAMNAVAASAGTSTVALIVDGASELTTLTFEHGLAMPAGALEPRFAKSLYRALPRTFVLHVGRVAEVWSSIATPDEVGDALRRLPAPTPPTP